jgi:hypothetical protein
VKWWQVGPGVADYGITRLPYWDRCCEFVPAKSQEKNI